MSLQFSDTTTRKGIIQAIERETGLGRNGISGDTNRLADFTADINIAYDEVLAFIFKCGGTWRFDDSNHEDDPVIYANLAAGQRYYYFTTDEGNNLILDFTKAFIKNGTVYERLYPVDVETEEDTTEFTDGLNAQGVAGRYDKLGNGIALDFVPENDVTDGLMFYIDREGSYFTTSEPSKKPGFAGLYHEILALIVSFKYATRNTLKNKNDLAIRVEKMWNAIEKHYTRRDKDTRQALSARKICAE